MEGASPRPEKRADIAKKERVKQLGVHSYPFPLWRNAAVLLLHPPLEGEGRPLERSESGRGGVNVRKERSPHPARHSASKTRVNALMARDPPPPGEGKDSGRTEPPVFFAAPGRPASRSSPSQNRGDGAPSGASVAVVTYRFRHVAPLGAPSRRSHCGAGPRFSGDRFAPPRPGRRGAFGVTAPSRSRTGLAGPAVSELLAGDRSIPGRSPGAAREGRSVRLPARAPHPAPLA